MSNDSVVPGADKVVDDERRRQIEAEEELRYSVRRRLDAEQREHLRKLLKTAKNLHLNGA
jgi:hypothetical protein